MYLIVNIIVRSEIHTQFSLAQKEHFLSLHSRILAESLGLHPLLLFGGQVDSGPGYLPGTKHKHTMHCINPFSCIKSFYSGNY